ncbi:MAG: DUF1836 domain-containing protein [Christensenellaceae bacterium]|jgi:DNA-binding transcriptional MerR regulator|nr:DUF1836 domain-containing protein [Christensenellaceae bacterium]
MLFESFQCPRWQELPQLELYMDQVCFVITGAIQPLIPSEETALTATMINNYVKIKLIAPPNKKKYGPEHVSRLIMVSLLKRILSLSEIAAVLDDLFTGRDAQAGYDLCGAVLEASLRQAELPADCPPLLAAALQALSGKLAVEALISTKA